MNWSELNAFLKFEISATRNCKRVTAVSGLRFAVCGLPDAKGLYYLKQLQERPLKDHAKKIPSGKYQTSNLTI